MHNLLFRLLQSPLCTETCQQYLEHQRWPHGVICPYCEGDRVSKDLRPDENRAPRWFCSLCRQKFSVYTGTVLERTKIRPNTLLLVISELMLDPSKKLNIRRELLSKILPQISAAQPRHQKNHDLNRKLELIVRELLSSVRQANSLKKTSAQ